MSEKTLTLSAHGIDVTVHRELRGLVFRADGTRRIDRELVIEHSTFELLNKVFGARAPRTGDEDFDRIFNVRGDDALVSAVLDAATRKRLLEIPSEISVAYGVITRIVTTRVTQKHVASVAGELAELCLALTCPMDQAPARLIRTLESETNPLAQRLQFTRLLDLDAAESLRARAIEIGLDSKDPEVLVRAAMRAGKRGEALLDHFALDGSFDDALRARIVQHKRRSGTLTLRASLELVAAGGGPLARVALARAISTMIVEPEEVKGAEQALFALLESPAVETQLAAIDAFGWIGSVAAVDTLQALAKGARASTVRTGAREAVRRIQARASSGEGGQLSIIEGGDAGSLSIANDLRGALSEEDA